MFINRSLNAMQALEAILAGGITCRLPQSIIVDNVPYSHALELPDGEWYLISRETLRMVDKGQSVIRPVLKGRITHWQFKKRE